MTGKIVELDFEQELYKYFGQVKDFTLGMRIAQRFYKLGKESQGQGCDDLEEEIIRYIGYPQEIDEDVSTTMVRKAARHFASWQKGNFWKPADGDDLPEIDREVIALEGIVDPTATDCLCGYKVVFAHRPTQEGYDGKSIATGEVEHYTPKTYGKGGWNIPDVKYWLDVKLPEETKL